MELSKLHSEPPEHISSHSRSVASLPCFSKPALMVHTHEKGMTRGKAECSELEKYLYCLAPYPVNTVDAITTTLVALLIGPSRF